MLHAQIVSAPMPLGVSWLVNCLLELGVRTTAYGTYWLDEPDGSRIGPSGSFDDLQWHLPVLHRQSRFRFREPLEVFWEHRLAFAHYPARKTILFVRDPRDAAYSQFRRHVHTGRYQNTPAGLLRFLRTPEIWRDSFPLLFDLPPAETLAYFCLFWLHQLPPDQLLTVRFEDCKQDPLSQLRRVLDFLGLQREDRELFAAIEGSQSEKAIAATASMQRRTGDIFLSNRAGLAFEWRRHYSPEALACFRGPAEQLIALLGYEPLPQDTPYLAGDNPELLQKAAPRLMHFHALIEAGDAGGAEHYLQTALQSSDQPLRLLLAGQWLALLWTRAVMRISQSHLPAALRMFRCFSALNARYACLPQVQQAAAAILDSEHSLHKLWPKSQLWFHAEGGPADFVPAAAAALASGLPYFLWKRRDLRIEPVGLFQLCALLERDYLDVAASVPVLEYESSADFSQRARALHAAWGAEYQRVRLQDLPPCLLLRSSLLADPGLEQPGWLAELVVHQALGVLAQLPARFASQPLRE